MILALILSVLSSVQPPGPHSIYELDAMTTEPQMWTPPPHAVGQKNALVLLGRFTDHTPTTTQAQAQAAFDGARAKILEFSYGACTLDIQVTPWLDLGIPRPPPNVAFDTCNYRDRALAAAQAAGFSIPDLKGFVFDATDNPAMYSAKPIVPGIIEAPCGQPVPSWNGGEAYLYGTQGLTPISLARMLCQIIGAQLDGFLVCGDGPDSNNCYMGRQVAYSGDPLKWHFAGDGTLFTGDLYSLMGGGADIGANATHPSPLNKIALGWIKPRRITASGVYEIPAFETSKDSCLLVRDRYHITYRRETPIGLGAPPASSIDGIFFHTPRTIDAIHPDNHEHEQLAMLGHLLCMRPRPDDVNWWNGMATYVCPPPPPPYPRFDNQAAAKNAVLGPGEKWTDPVHHDLYEVLSIDAQKAVVRITGDFTAPSCVITSPASGAHVHGKIKIVTQTSPDVVKVEFWLDSMTWPIFVASGPSPTWTYSPSVGAHTIFAKAFDAAQNVGVSQTVTVIR